MDGNNVSERLQQEQAQLTQERQNRELKLRFAMYIYTGIIVLFGIILYLYCEKRVLKPFRKLKQFARDVALGNLDIPLEMDVHGNFGAFTESFDLMREELKTARENERSADRSKKELVAQLSHDIKTPVASIKAAVELMQITSDDVKLEQINEKAEQINTLITNMFHSTLEELQELSVNASEIQNTAISQIIESADYKGKIKPPFLTIPDCIVIADTVRLQQVFDNIIGNSYKYAGTEIEVNAGFDGNRLVIAIVDFGGCVLSGEDLPLLCSKFYRGKNSENQSGYGLGLYISRYLMKNMSGDLLCEKTDNGFCVKIVLKLA
jgi:signal transduction histidine kinase